MGTNFYWQPPDVSSPSLHIGKRSAAGGGLCSFSLQGHRENVDTPIDSWERWKNVILYGAGIVTDEYGAVHQDLDFIVEVESTTPENRRRQYDWMVEHYEGDSLLTSLMEEEWLCPDGFSFSWREFT